LGQHLTEEVKHFPVSVRWFLHQRHIKHSPAQIRHCT